MDGNKYVYHYCGEVILNIPVRMSTWDSCWVVDALTLEQANALCEELTQVVDYLNIKRMQERKLATARGSFAQWKWIR